MSESFKQQGVPREVPGVIREDQPSPLLGRSDDSVSPAGLSPLGVDGTGLQVNVSPTEPGNDLPLDSSSGHKGLHSPLPTTESPDQRFGLLSGQPDFSRPVWLCRSNILDGVVGYDFDLYKVIRKDGECSAIPDLRAPAYREALEKDGDIALGELFRAEASALGDHAPDLSDVFGIRLPLSNESGNIYLLEAVNKRWELVRFVCYEEIGQGGSFEDYHLKRLPLKTTLEGSYHLLDSARRCVVRGATGLRSSPLVREVEPSFPDATAFGSEGHLDAGDAPADAPVSRARIYGWGVTLYPGRDSNSYAGSPARDFETISSPKRGNALPDSPSVEPSSGDQASVAESLGRCPPEMPRSHGGEAK